MALALFPGEVSGLRKAAGTFRIRDGNRGSWRDFRGRRVFLDAYNANPASVRASLQGFEEELGEGSKALLVLGDMNELGEASPRHHEELGRHVRERGHGHVVFIGRHAEAFRRGHGGGVRTYPSVAEFKKDWPDFLRQYKIFFLKASRTLRLESCLD